MSRAPRRYLLPPVLPLARPLLAPARRRWLCRSPLVAPSLCCAKVCYMLAHHPVMTHPRSHNQSIAPLIRLCSIWDDGTVNPEPCLDQFTLVSKYQALGWLLGGLGFFAVAGSVAAYSAPEKRVPWVSRGAPRGGAGWEVTRWSVGACLVLASLPLRLLIVERVARLPVLQVPKDVVVPPEVAPRA